MHCNIMICAHKNIMAHYDATMDIHSNIITYGDVIIGHGTKLIVYYVIPIKSSAQNRISTRDLKMEILFKTGHSMALSGEHVPGEGTGLTLISALQTHISVAFHICMSFIIMPANS